MTIENKPIRISGVKYSQTVGKSISLDADGTSLIKKQILGARGTAGELLNRTFDTPREFFEWRRTLTAETMLFSGTFDPDVEAGSVVPKVVLGSLSGGGSETDVFAATKESLAHREQPGVLMIDVDSKDPTSVEAMWPNETFAIGSADQVRQALLEVLPEAAACPMLILASSSSMIARKSDGQILKGAGGWRLYVPVNDASHIPALLETIHLRCWALSRYRLAFVSASGQVLFRSLADLALARPTQPDYVTAELADELERCRDVDREYCVDGAWLDGSSVELSHGDRSLALAAMVEAKTKLQGVSAGVKAARIKGHTQEAVARGVDHHSAQRAAIAMYERSVLLGSEEVCFADGKKASVEHLLEATAADFDTLECFDPAEPSYDGGRVVAKFFRNDGINPLVYSFAHGGRLFFLRHDAQTAERAIAKAGRDHIAIYRILALAKDGTTLTEFEYLEGIAARALNIGNRRQGLRDEVRKLYRPLKPLAFADGTASIASEVRCSLDEKIPRDTFPKNSMTAQGLVVLDHLENVEHLIKAYGFGVRYDVISKQTEWTHPQLKQIGDNAENELTSRLLGLCSMNGVPKANLATHLLAIANANSYNPVTDTLKALAWDGKPRFNDVVEAMQFSDPAIGRIAFRILLIQACAAADHGEIGMTKNADAVAHFASVIVLVGDQGIGKTRGLRRLMPSSLRAYYKESIILDLSNKDSRLQAISGWITELGELDSTFKKSDIVQLKAFLTSSEDEIRTPYAPKASKYARRCVFFGTVNDTEFLSDETGNRRFIPLSASNPYLDWSDNELDQLWAEAWHRYCSGEPWWPTEEEARTLADHTDGYRVRSSLEEKIERTFQWGSDPDMAAGRRTAAEILNELYPHNGVPLDKGYLKSTGNCLRRLWKASGKAQDRNGALHVCNQGNWVPVNSTGGKNRGWLLPPKTIILPMSSLLPNANSSGGEGGG